MPFSAIAGLHLNRAEFYKLFARTPRRILPWKLMKMRINRRMSPQKKLWLTPKFGHVWQKQFVSLYRPISRTNYGGISVDYYSAAFNLPTPSSKRLGHNTARAHSINVNHPSRGVNGSNGARADTESHEQGRKQAKCHCTAGGNSFPCGNPAILRWNGSRKIGAAATIRWRWATALILCGLFRFRWFVGSAPAYFRATRTLP